MNSLRNTLHLVTTAKLSLTQPSSSSVRSLRSYSKTPNRKKKLSPSFKPGPFQGALLTNPNPELNPTSNHHEDQKNQVIQNHPREQPITNIKHDYSPSQLVKSLKHNNSNSSHSKLHFPHSDSIQDHLRDLLYPLNFSDQVACRIVSSKNLVKSQDSLDLIQSNTPGGVGFAVLGEHNAKFSFIGRRMMHFALTNFLIHAPRIEGSKNAHSSEKMISEVIEEALLTKFVLGQYVGHQWELEKIMRWRELSPLSSPDQTNDPLELKNKILMSTGLWTARGHVVEAILGAVMTQHGARLSNAIFNSLVLPHLSFRLDPSYIPAIKAIQNHDRELDNPRAGLVDWNQLDILPFTQQDDHVTASSSSTRSLPIAAVG